MNITIAKKIMGKNFIGADELSRVSSWLGIIDPIKKGLKIPAICFTEQCLRQNRKDCVLILGMSTDKNDKKLTLNTLRVHFGWDPKKVEPCFYNQDWYLKEAFADKAHLKFQWYLVSKKVKVATRGQNPDSIKRSIKRGYAFPSAVLVAFTFFAYYFHTKGEILWKHDFIWCSDKDKNGDRIYVGRYNDPRRLNKNGFSIHRHLRIRSCYGLSPQIM